MTTYEGGHAVSEDDVLTTAAAVAEQQLHQDLETTKATMHEISERQGRIVDLGTLSGGQHEELWSQADNAISLKRRVESGEVTEAEVAAVPTNLSRSFVPVEAGAAKRCIDGSSVEGFDDNDAEKYGKGLGPQIQGGTADEAVAARLTKGFEDGEEATQLSDMETHVEEHESDFKPGDHTDDHANEQKSGCGAQDGHKRKLPMYSDPERAPILESVANTIMELGGAQPRPGAFARLQESARQLRERPDYFPAPNAFLDKLRQLNPDGVETLVRPHAEISLTLNFVSGTTFHRDHYNANTNSKIQNFNLDVWAILDEYGEDGYALIVDAVATAMDLTDGSLRLFARVPNEEQVEAGEPVAA
jgi:hypothetical protein